jgi:hypothetical protein
METLPSWFGTEPTPKQAKTALMELNHVIYEIAFPHAMSQVAAGVTLRDIVTEYHTEIDLNNFRNWIHRDPERKALYYEAKAIGADAIEDEILTIADAKDSLEDVQRSALKINSRKWVLGVRDRKRYGDVKQLDVTNTTTVDIKGLIEQRDQQLMNGLTLDGESTVVQDNE